MAKVLITILGMIGKNQEGEYNKAEYYFNEAILEESPRVNYVNTFPLFVTLFASKYRIVPIYTKKALSVQADVLKHHELPFDIKANGELIDEENFDAAFSKINTLLENQEYKEVVIDVSHGFRHLPMLTTVAMLIENFKNPHKIKHVLFAKEIVPSKLYEIIDLHDYLDIANIAFILSAFESNYTVANHIEARKYSKLTTVLNDLSNDIMALNLNNLFNVSAKKAIDELDNIDDISIQKQAKRLKKHLESTFNKEEKRYKTYYKLARALYERSYLLASLSLLNESIRLYIKSSIKKEERSIVEKVERHFKDDLYKIGDFFKNLYWKSFDKLTDKERCVSEKEYKNLVAHYPKYIQKLYEDIDARRNNLTHANSKGSFKEIKDDIGSLLDEYQKNCITKKSASTLADHFSAR